ncbi:hypothetical protein XELAEV_18000720mg [Xenopus laevis]|uniref:Uncharacterized protein n=1 Tax=Xenopus laevis TaxID=8355 RepID=A0A974BP24_XENLA|nr:hypothetical protein XELAEV_18000720mg [Xenopus laevis]
MAHPGVSINPSVSTVDPDIAGKALSIVCTIWHSSLSINGYCLSLIEQLDFWQLKYIPLISRFFIAVNETRTAKKPLCPKLPNPVKDLESSVTEYKG